MNFIKTQLETVDFRLVLTFVGLYELNCTLTRLWVSENYQYKRVWRKDIQKRAKSRVPYLHALKLPLYLTDTDQWEIFIDLTWLATNNALPKRTISYLYSNELQLVLLDINFKTLYPHESLNCLMMFESFSNL